MPLITQRSDYDHKHSDFRVHTDSCFEIGSGVSILLGIRVWYTRPKKSEGHGEREEEEEEVGQKKKKRVRRCVELALKYFTFQMSDNKLATIL